MVILLVGRTGRNTCLIIGRAMVIPKTTRSYKYYMDFILSIRRRDTE